MKLLKLKPNTPGTRHQLNLSKNLLSKNNYTYKKLNFNIYKANGHSTQTGHITVWHRGGGCKKRYRNINFTNETIKALNISTYYDPYRSSFISLVFDFKIKKFYYFIAAQTVLPGSILNCQSFKTELFFGTRTKLENFYAGNTIYNISLSNFGYAKYSRAAGTCCQIVQKTNIISHVRIPSGKIIILSSNNYANLGRVSNIKHNLIVDGKAGRNRLRGFRPIVRGIAMNPVDHPHGGRTNGGRPSVSPWGILTKGKPTVKKIKNEQIKVKR